MEKKYRYNLECPYCGEICRGNNTTPFSTHMRNAHGIDTKEKYIDFIRNVFWPKYHPELPNYCVVCGKETSFINFDIGFYRSCNEPCKHILGHYPDATPEELKQHLDEYYARKKREKDKSVLFRFVTVTVLDKYDLSPKVCNNKKLMILWNKTIIGPEKAADIVFEKYGNRKVGKVKELIEKREATCLEKYGHKSCLGNKEINDKSKATKNNKTKEEKQEIIEQMKRTNLERYGVTCTVHAPGIKEKVKATLLEKYGVDVPSKNKEIALRAGQKTRINIGVNSLNKWLEHNNLTLISDITNYIERLPLILKCNKCSHEFEYKYDSIVRIQYVHCPKCYCPYKVSSQEDKVANLLTSYGINIVRNSKMLEFDGSRKEVDIYIPSHKLGIEVDGLYWHKEDNQKHLLKTKLLQEQYDAQLLHITDNEIDNNWETVQSIIKAKLGIFDRRIYARKCSIKEISGTEYKQFCENYHIQGYASASDLFGLIFENELVAICSFGLSRTNGKELELIRFCCKHNTQVIGGLSKFIKFYLRNSKYNLPLISFCDLRYASAKGYCAVGFVPVSYTPPQYWYFSQQEYWLHNRRGFQRKYLEERLANFDPELSEHENCMINGWFRYYDCGSVKMLYKG